MVLLSSPSTEPPSIPLIYSIAGCSEHSGKYVSENILVDSPLDQTSRWSGAYQAPNMKQWVLLKLEKPSILKNITFGKFHKPHPCNMKEFKLYVGMTSEHMVEVLHTGLKNDAVPETFSVRHTNASAVCFPTLYVKIVPLSAHGQSFHTSIWYVSLSGIIDEYFLEQVCQTYEKSRERTVIRHVLKHLRQRRLLTPYSSILSRINIRLEHPLITKLHRHLVLEGSWPETEATLRKASEAGLFDAYHRACQPTAIWTRLHGTDADGDIPCARGGHAMCIDTSNSMIYMLGGWDGAKTLDDFWVYDIKKDKWRILSHSTSQQKNGPGSRSCHKMVFDLKSGCIYLLGRLGDEGVLTGETPRNADSGSAASATQSRNGENPPPTTTPYCSEFYRYHTCGLDSGTWDLLSFDTASAGGPPLVFDHQMVIDSESQMLYVSGGRVVDGDWKTNKYSGLYSYNVKTSKWKLLLSCDTSPPNHIPSRFGHSMIFSPTTQTLFIFAGQREDKYLSDMYEFDLRTNTVRELFANFSGQAVGGPDACFTQRAVVDVSLAEIYVFCGLTRNQHHGSMTILRSDAPNWVYRYDTRPGRWTPILAQYSDEGYQRGMEEPQPRYAHQVVYDPHTKTVYMHGGNAGLKFSLDRDKPRRGQEEGVVDDPDGNDKAEDTAQEDAKRLDDFWSMTLKRPAQEEIIRRATYLIRRQQFREMCEEQPPVKALNFLQTEVSVVVDHNDPEETGIFRSLLSHLLAPSAQRNPSSPSTPESPWTNNLDEDEIMGNVAEMDGTSLESEDPEERAIRGDRAPLSGARFQQRTEAFEALLAFVGEDAREPTGSLLDLVDGDVGLP